jgi:hypothetical protein
VHEYSSNSGTSYDPLSDGSNHVLNITYDGAGNVTGTTWSAT